MSYEIPQQYSGPGVSPQLEDREGNGKLKKGKAKSTKRVVGTQRKLFLVFAVLVGLFAVLALTNTGSKSYVARTSVPINAFTEINESLIEVVAIDSSAIEPDTWSGKSSNEVTSKVLADIVGKRTAFQLGSKQQLRISMFVDRVSPSTPLLPDERLVSISAKASAAVVGSIRAGDKVDVYGTTAQGLSGLLASDIEVVAVSVAPQQLDSASQEQINDKDKTLAELVPGDPIPGTYVLRIRASEVSKIISADSGGAIYLSLRGIDAGVTEESVSDITTAICSGNRSVPSCNRG
ncbi:MAG: RcpC/CpaB family pilus assembly protein [Candidatus Paceibacterota bacterium]